MAGTNDNALLADVADAFGFSPAQLLEMFNGQATTNMLKLCQDGGLKEKFEDGTEVKLDTAQVTGIRAMLCGKGSAINVSAEAPVRCVLDFCMGSGKTLMALGAAAYLAKNKKKTIIVVPPNLIETTWETEVAEFVDTGKLKMRFVRNMSSFGKNSWEEAIKDHDVLVVTYSVISSCLKSGWSFQDGGATYTTKTGAVRKKKGWVKQDGHPLLDEKWGLVVYDEAHALKNPDTLG